MWMRCKQPRSMQIRHMQQPGRYTNAQTPQPKALHNQRVLSQGHSLPILPSKQNSIFPFQSLPPLPLPLLLLSPTLTNPSKNHSSHSTPQPYTTASYTVFKTGTKSNSTHWQFTALCSGCTSWSADGGAVRYVQPNGGNRLAFAYSPNKPSNPSSPSSAITVHDVHAYWNHDFNTARNSGFEAAVQRLLGR